MKTKSLLYQQSRINEIKRIRERQLLEQNNRLTHTLENGICVKCGLKLNKANRVICTIPSVESENVPQMS